MRRQVFVALLVVALVGAGAQGREDKPGHKNKVRLALRNSAIADKAVVCVQKMHQMAKDLVSTLGSLKLKFPIECCDVKPFASTCKRLGKTKDEMAKAIKKKLDPIPLHSHSEREIPDLLLPDVCDGKVWAPHCCPSSNKDDRNVVALPRDVKRHERQLFVCTTQLFLNIIRFKWEVPDACCKVFIFKIFAKCRGPPNPNPTWAPKPPKPKPTPPNPPI